ncbi:RNA 2',3'-cyclic phosphodiesterase [Halanaerobacter jeridensis]|uniref:RNA 2',3'-cyclic phosphodiesterase n=1 Tax=Halanaerobacter jeridensis TaxID=706427 RepID=A0A939BQ86_9FIRM|nr:RNA 2',3'-cyclic phosphodiesterase [Halanaerobacter jeridensis]MBM7556029.1 2'-5' RNA ligase [Halanaerobacter jeridensis]
MKDTKRVFIAVELSDVVQGKLDKAQNMLRDCSLNIKWVEKENFHITLKFLGDLTKAEIMEVKEEVAAIAKKSLPFDIIIDGLGAFPNIEYPKVIWAGVEKNKRQLINVHEAIETRMFDLGFEEEKHDYTPHITLGRVRKKEKNYELISEKIEKFPFEIQARQIVDKITVMKSKLTPQGPIYSPVAEFEFGNK